MAHRDATFAHSGDRRTGCVWLLLDDEDRVIVVNPGYSGKASRYQLVGGCATADEPPHLAAVREAYEEIGLRLVADTLLITDYVRANPDSGSVEGTNLVFFHRLGPGDSITLNAGGTPDGEEAELLDFKMLAADELTGRCPAFQARRIREAMAAVADPTLRGYRFEGHRLTDAV